MSYRKDYGKSVSIECSQALTRFACVTAFPECSLAGNSFSSISYYLPCKVQCEQANARCPFKIDCTPYPSVNCMLSLPTGYFMIDPLSGPFEPLEYIYIISLAFWTIFTITWNYLTFIRHKNACVAFCRVVSGIPIIKGTYYDFATCKMAFQTIGGYCCYGSISSSEANTLLFITFLVHMIDFQPKPPPIPPLFLPPSPT